MLFGVGVLLDSLLLDGVLLDGVLLMCIMHHTYQSANVEGDEARVGEGGWHVVLDNTLCKTLCNGSLACVIDV